MCIDREAPPRGEPLPPLREPLSLRLADLAFISGEDLPETLLSMRTLYGRNGGVGPGGRDWRMSVRRRRIDSNVGLHSQEMRYGIGVQMTSGTSKRGVTRKNNDNSMCHTLRFQPSVIW